MLQPKHRKHPFPKTANEKTILEYAFRMQLETLVAVGTWVARRGLRRDGLWGVGLALFDDLYSNLERISGLYKETYKTLPVHMRFPFADKRGETASEQPTEDFPAPIAQSEREDTAK